MRDAQQKLAAVRAEAKARPPQKVVKPAVVNPPQGPKPVTAKHIQPKVKTWLNVPAQKQRPKATPETAVSERWRAPRWSPSNPSVRQTPTLPLRREMTAYPSPQQKPQSSPSKPTSKIDSTLLRGNVQDMDKLMFRARKKFDQLDLDCSGTYCARSLRTLTDHSVINPTLSSPID